MKDKLYFNERGDLVTGVDDTHIFVIRAEQVRVIVDNICRGINYPYCSPMQPITREQLAYIITHCMDLTYNEDTQQ
jgi:hypothetical protein